jgi:hypothetical protein
MGEPTIQQRPGESVEGVIMRCMDAVEGGREKMVTCQTRHGVRFRAFPDDSWDDVVARFIREMDRKARCWSVSPLELAARVMVADVDRTQEDLVVVAPYPTPVLVVEPGASVDSVVAALQERVGRGVVLQVPQSQVPVDSGDGACYDDPSS